MTRKQRLIVAVAAPVLAAACFIFGDRLVFLVGLLNGCTFNKITGFYCPGCGNTRSMNAIFHGDFLLALRNNATIPFILLVLAAFYAENIFVIFGKEIRLVPRNGRFWWAVLFLFFTYFVVRNFIPAIQPLPM